MTRGPVGVGLAGAGNVAGQYLESLLSYPDVFVAGLADLDVGRARQVAAAHGIGFAGTVAQLLDRDEVELVVNITVPAAHAEVALAAIAAGRHVWGEKPLAVDRASARSVLDAAAAAGVAVGNAPDTILGPAIQHSQRLLADADAGAGPRALAPPAAVPVRPGRGAAVRHRALLRDHAGPAAGAGFVGVSCLAPGPGVAGHRVW